MAKKQPKVLVLDLDYTLWPFWVDTHVSPPFRRSGDDCIIDSYGSKVTVYPGVPELLHELYMEGYVLAVASRTGEIEGARQLVDLFGWSKYFTYKEIFPGSKVTHIKNIKRAADVDFDEMIFFDDESRNIRDVSKLGVLSILVKDGLTRKTVDNALAEFSKRK